MTDRFTRPSRKAFLKLAAAGASAALGLGALPALAADPAPEWPTKPVRIITPFPVGAGPEGVVRLLADKLQKAWGKPVIVENRPGGNGFIAIDAFRQGAKDGHDLIHLDNVHLVAYPHLFKKLPYDPVKDFEPVLPLFRANFFLTTAANSKYRNVGDILAEARANPGKLNYGSWSVGNPVHLGTALLEAMTNTEMQHVVYKETSQLYTGVANGELNFALGTMATAGPLQRAGKIKFIGTIGLKRHPAFPDVPTVAESGGPAGYEVSGWTTIATPKGLPRAVAERIQRDIEKALAEPEIAQRYATFGYDLFPTTREQFGSFIQSESTKWAGVIQRAKASLD